MGKKIVIGIGVFAAIVVAGLAYVWFSAGSGEPSAEVTAPTIATTAATTAATEATEATEGTEATEATESTEAPGGLAGQVTFDIDKTQSSVQFEIDEILDGAPKRVIGTTTEVAGQVLIDFDDPTSSQLGTIVVNVRTLSTDNEFRNRAIRGQILNSSSDEHEFAEFAPTSIEGLPGGFAVGDTASITVTGDFLLSGVTKPVTFDLEVTLISETELQVTGSALTTRTEFELSIPSVTRVAEVSDEITLVVEFIATRS